MIQKQNFYTNEGIIFYVQFWQPVRGMILIIFNLQPNFINFNHGKESSSLMKKKKDNSKLYVRINVKGYRMNI